MNDTTVELTERNQSLKIAPVKPENEGKYSCVVKNRLHKESARGYVTIAGEGGGTVFHSDVSGHTEYSFFLFDIFYKLKMMQLCSIKMKSSLCTIVSRGTENGFMQFKL